MNTRNVCESCDKRQVRGRNFLCHACKSEEEARDKESLELQGYEFRLGLPEVIQDLPALRINR
jgi:hypothetical protein